MATSTLTMVVVARLLCTQYLNRVQRIISTLPLLPRDRKITGGGHAIHPVSGDEPRRPGSTRSLGHADDEAVADQAYSRERLAWDFMKESPGQSNLAIDSEVRASTLSTIKASRSGPDLLYK